MTYFHISLRIAKRAYSFEFQLFGLMIHSSFIFFEGDWTKPLGDNSYGWEEKGEWHFEFITGYPNNYFRYDKKWAK